MALKFMCMKNLINISMLVLAQEPILKAIKIYINIRDIRENVFFSH